MIVCAVSVVYSLLVGCGLGPTFVDCDGSVPSTTCNWVKLQVLLERLPLTRCVVESLLLVVDRQKVEGRHKQNRERERNSWQTNLASIHTTSEGSSKDDSAENVICQNQKFIS